MRRRVFMTMSCSLLAVGAAALWAPVALAQQVGNAGSLVLVGHDVSPPLRRIVPVEREPGQRSIPLRPVGPRSSALPDGAQQLQVLPLVSAGESLGFEGVGLGNGYAVNAAPPDTEGSVGFDPTTGKHQYVQWVNEAFAVFDADTGAQIYPASGGAAGNTIWSGFTAGNCSSNNDGDPIVLYDKAAHRWLMTQFSVTGGPPYYQCVAVSQTPDATGAWNRYAYSFGNGFNDYPKFGVWPDAYYASFNIFNNGTTFAGPKVCAFDRAAMLAGTTAGSVCFQLPSSNGALLPSDLDGSTPPPAGSPNYFVGLGSSTSLNVYKFHVDFATPSNSTLTGPSAITVASYNQACGGGACVPQPGTRQKLDSLGDRVMYRLAYRNFGTGQESLVVNHSVNVGSSKRSTYTAVRWYELRVSNFTPKLYQQGTFAPNTNFRWMGSLAMDKVGNMLLGYSESNSKSLYPSIFYTGRVPTDPLGTMETESSILAGTGSQLPNLNRWGDYSTMSIDPKDDCTFWYTQEYLGSSGDFNWHTYVKSIKFPSCS
ncbi:MAG: hypothetical protein PHQ91_13920 [Thermoanaerobaculaceae bacterium]|nr:hypothetical protein [Thermoanaerobaculaceae bacterium]